MRNSLVHGDSSHNEYWHLKNFFLGNKDSCQSLNDIEVFFK